MGYRVLVSEDEGRKYWHNHRDVVRWQVIEGELVLYYPDTDAVTKYECWKWIKVEEIK